MSSPQVQYVLALKDLLTGGIQNADNAASKLHSTMSNLGAAIGVTFGVAGVAAFARSMADAGMQVENARTGLTTLLKSSSEASSVIKNTMEDATKTPFVFEGLLMANKALIAADENSVAARENVLNLANAIAATGGGDDELQRMVVNLQQIKNTGRATALDIRQFAYAGVNLYKALDEAGIKYGKDAELTYEQITLALQKAHDVGGIYYNGLENMAGNTSVQVSNLGDAIFQLKVKMFEDLKPAIESLVEGAKAFIDRLAELWKWIMAHREAIKGFTLILVEMWAAFKLFQGLQYIIPLIASFGATLTLSLGPISLVVAALAGLAYAYNEVAGAADRAREAQKSQQDNLISGLQQDMETVAQIYTKNGMKEIDARKKVSKERLEMYMQDFRALEEVLAKEDAALEQAKWYNQSGQDELMTKRNATAQKINSLYEVIQAAKAFGEEGSRASMAGGAKSSAKASVTPAAKTKATAARSVTINVSIGDLIKEFNINTTNIKEGAYKVREAVTNALMGAVNDFQITAGQ